MPITYRLNVTTKFLRKNALLKKKGIIQMLYVVYIQGYSK